MADAEEEEDRALPSAPRWGEGGDGAPEPPAPPSGPPRGPKILRAAGIGAAVLATGFLAYQWMLLFRPPAPEPEPPAPRSAPSLEPASARPDFTSLMRPPGEAPAPLQALPILPREATPPCTACAAAPTPAPAKPGGWQDWFAAQQEKRFLSKKAAYSKIPEPDQPAPGEHLEWLIFNTPDEDYPVLGTAVETVIDGRRGWVQYAPSVQGGRGIKAVFRVPDDGRPHVIEAFPIYDFGTDGPHRIREVITVSADGETHYMMDTGSGAKVVPLGGSIQLGVGN